MQPLRVAILGNGAVARTIGPALERAGVEVLVWCRTGTPPFGRAVELEDLGQCAAAWLLVSDDALAEVSRRLNAAGAPPVVLHASGSIDYDVLAVDGARGALHPLASFVAGEPTEIEGMGASFSGEEGARAVAFELARLLGLEPFDLPGGAPVRAAYHGAAVLAAGGVAALIDLAAEALPEGAPREAGRRALAALAGGVAERVARRDARSALSGPLARGELEVVAGHLAALPEEARELYRLLARRMLALASLDQERAAAMRALLGE